MDIEILKLIAGSGGGGVLICVVFVYLFLKHIEGLRVDHSVAMKGLTDKVIDIAEKTSEALYEVKSAIVELQARIK